MRRFRELAAADAETAQSGEPRRAGMPVRWAGASAWRHLRSDRSVVNNRLDRGTVRRVLRVRAAAPAR